jgi:hypothetical protein
MSSQEELLNAISLFAERARLAADAAENLVRMLKNRRSYSKKAKEEDLFVRMKVKFSRV